MALSTSCSISRSGVSIAYVVVRTKFTLTAPLLDAAAMLPLAVPGLVMAFGYLAISREGKPLSFLNPTLDPTLLLVIAYAIRRLPFVVRSTTAGLQQISETLEEAPRETWVQAPLRVFSRVTLPLLESAPARQAVFSLSRSRCSRFPDSIILAQKPSTFPITKAINELFQLLGDGRQVAAALGAWAMLFLMAALASARALLGRRAGRGSCGSDLGRCASPQRPSVLERPP